MDSRSFIIGLICGAVVGVIAGRFLGGEIGEDVATGAERETNSAIVQDELNAAPSASNITQEPPTDANQETSDPQASSDTSVEPVAPWPANLRAKLKLEPKDDSWAYYMEQTLLQYLSTHSSIEQFDISRIECRTIKCQIEVFGYDKSTVPVWQQVMYDVGQQPWSEFGQYGTSSGTVDGRLMIVGTFHRKTDPD